MFSIMKRRYSFRREREIEVDLLRLRNKGEEYKEKDANNSCGFYVENGIVVNAQRYLEALKVLIEFEAAKNADADVSFAFRKHHVESLEEIMKRPNESTASFCAAAVKF